jgi:hypothetical protein
MLLLFPLTLASLPSNASETGVIAVQDITAQVECVYTAESFADKAQTILLKRDSYPCPPGSVLHAERMTEEEARSRGLVYVVATGDPDEDERAVDLLKLQLLEAVRGQTPAANGLIESDFSRRASCGTPTYRNRGLSYNAEGGRVNTTVSYHDVTDSYPYGCNVILIYQSYTYLSVPLTPGEDLYWDEERYPTSWHNYPSWGMSCQQYNYGSTDYTYMSWYVEPNHWLTDESINDTSFGCTWWGEEYTGMVILDA